MGPSTDISSSRFPFNGLFMSVCSVPGPSHGCLFPLMMFLSALPFPVEWIGVRYLRNRSKFRSSFDGQPVWVWFVFYLPGEKGEGEIWRGWIHFPSRARWELIFLVPTESMDAQQSDGKLVPVPEMGDPVFSWYCWICLTWSRTPWWPYFPCLPISPSS